MGDRPTLPEVLTLQEVAILLDRSVRQLRAEARNGSLRGTKFSDDPSDWRFLRDDILAKRARGAPAPRRSVLAMITRRMALRACRKLGHH